MANRGGASFKILKEDANTEQRIDLYFEGGHAPVVIITRKIDGITPEMWNWYQVNMVENISKKDKNLQMKKLKDGADGSQIVYQRILTPAVVSNRSMILTNWADY